jgi:hypothetical protein
VTDATSRRTRFLRLVLGMAGTEVSEKVTVVTVVMARGTTAAGGQRLRTPAAAAAV